MSDNELIILIISGAIEAYKKESPGFLGSAYKECLLYGLKKLGLIDQEEKSMPKTYKKLKLYQVYRIDLLKENKVAIEIKLLKHSQSSTSFKHSAALRWDTTNAACCSINQFLN